MKNVVYLGNSTFIVEYKLIHAEMVQESSTKKEHTQSLAVQGLLCISYLPATLAPASWMQEFSSKDKMTRPVT